MNVIPISSKTIFKDFVPRAEERMSEGAKFLVAAILNFWGPTLSYCYLIGEALPFYLMLCVQTIGVILGVLIYNQKSDGLLSCVPINSRPDLPHVTHTRVPKRAA
jgi:hypothetical protein